MVFNIVKVSCLFLYVAVWMDYHQKNYKKNLRGMLPLSTVHSRQIELWVIFLLPSVPDLTKKITDKSE